MEEADSTYAPESPDLSGYHSYDTEPVHPQHQGYRGSISLASPYTPVDATNALHAAKFAQASYFPRQQSVSQPPVAPAAMPRRVKTEGGEDGPWQRTRKQTRQSPPEPVPTKMEVVEDNGKPAPGTVEGIEVKTKFPVARIKRIMQADEDVGKVAQVTPVVVSKALELFMISLVTKSAAEAKARGQKRIGAAHLKQAVLKEKQFDFLSEIVAKVADAPAPSDHPGDDSGDVKRKKPVARRRKKDDDDF